MRHNFVAMKIYIKIP